MIIRSITKRAIGGCAFQKGVVRGRMIMTMTLLLLHACATVTVPRSDGGEETMTIEDFERYAEAVFRRQNQASNQVIMLAGEVGRTTDQALAQAEQRMLAACRPLNEIAARQRDQASVGLPLQLEIAQTIDACDRATQSLETLLLPFEQ